MGERYTETALHFEVERLPPLLIRSLPAGPLALADLGCGDGPLFAALSREGLIDATRPVYAVDLEAARLARVSARFPWIVALVASADSVPAIPDGSLDAVVSTTVMEHVPDEQAYLAEIHRVLRPGGRAYVTTVFKRNWARLVLPQARRNVRARYVAPARVHRPRRLPVARDELRAPGRRARTQAPLVPLLDPLLFRAGGRLASHRRTLRALRAAKVPIPGYYSLEH